MSPGWRGPNSRDEQIALPPDEAREEPLILAPVHVQHRAGQPGHRLAQLDDGPFDRFGGRALQGHRPDHLASGGQRHAQRGADAVGAHKVLVGARHRRSHALGRRIPHCRALVDGFVHGGSDGAQQIGALLELRTVRHGVDLDLPAAQEPDAHALAMQPGRELGGQRSGRGGEAVMGGGGGHQLQHRLQALFGGRLASDDIAGEQHLQAGGAPVQLAQCRLQLGLGAGRHVEHHDPAQLADGLDGIGDMEAVAGRVGCAGRNDQAALLDQRALGGVGEIAHVAAHVRPDGRGPVAAFGLDQQQNQAALDRRDEPALNGEPALAELLGVVGAGQDRPELGVVTGLVEQRRARPCAGLSSYLGPGGFEAWGRHGGRVRLLRRRPGRPRQEQVYFSSP